MNHGSVNVTDYTATVQWFHVPVKCTVSAGEISASKCLLKLLAVLPPVRCKFQFLQY